jgi:hypothetical protein
VARSRARTVATATPAITIATPSSWTADGASERSTAARNTVLTGWSIRTIEVSTAGRRGSDTEISSQPSTCEDSASSTSQAWDSRPGTQSMSPTTIPPIAENSAPLAVASSKGPAGLRSSLFPWRSTRMKSA